VPITETMIIIIRWVLLCKFLLFGSPRMYTLAHIYICGQCCPLITRFIIALPAAHVLRKGPSPAATFLHQIPNGHLLFTVRKHSAEYHYKLLYLYYTRNVNERSNIIMEYTCIILWVALRNVK